MSIPFFASKKTLKSLLPKVRGTLQENISLSKKTWFGVGGPAEVYFEPKDTEDLCVMIANMPNIPVTVIGGGSNLLIRDGGIPGLVIHLGKPFSSVSKHSRTEASLCCGAAAPLKLIAQFAVQEEIGGLEFLEGIPGSLGGALRMNAGAFGHEMKNIVQAVEIIDARGLAREITAEELHFEYRTTTVPPEWIFVGAKLTGYKEDSDKIKTRMEEYRMTRTKTQPVGERTAGSTFKNPEGFAAWRLIEEAGCRGLVHKGAKMSEKHCNFMVNMGTATALALEELGEIVQNRVKTKTGIDLEWEIRRVGVKTPQTSSFGGMKK